MAGTVIIGAGECGVRAAFSLREQGFQEAITLIGDEAALPYERPPLSKQSNGTAKPIRPRQAYDDAQITLRLGERVSQIARHTRHLQFSESGTLTYDTLLLATGAQARLFANFRGCRTLRTDRDAAAILSRLSSGAKIGIIGGGFIGLELAATARLTGAAVTLVEAAPRLLARSVPEDIARKIEARHLAEGVELRTGASVIEATENTITFDGSKTQGFDAVIAGVGSAPNTELAEAAGLEVQNGIKVDGSFRTSDPHIFAAGDCCNFPWRGARIRLESWKAAQDQGAYAAAAMLGNAQTGEPYNKVPWFWSDQYDLTLQVAGLFDPTQAVQERDVGADATVVFQCDARGCLFAAAGIGHGNAAAKDVRIFEKLIERDAPTDPSRLADPSQNLKRLLRAG